MATTTPEPCPSCGAPRPANAPRGLCPRCLLRDGLDSDALSLSRAGEIGTTLDLAGPPSVLATLAATVGPVPRVLLTDTDLVTGPGPVVQPASPEMPAPTDRAARLQLFGEIAHGGMGAILKGRDVDIGRDLAVKVLLEIHKDNPDLVHRFVEEAQIAGQLQHPGVVPVYELGAFADRRPYFSMKLVKGQTLAALLAARSTKASGRREPADDATASGRREPADDATASGRREPADAPHEYRPEVSATNQGADAPRSPDHDFPRFLAIFEAVCQTVAYAHARGVIHRDLKPSNVMVGSFGEVQVMDWGLAKVLKEGGVADEAATPAPQVSVIQTARSGSDADASRAGSILGTPAYMSPEQARGEIDAVDRRSDVFGLGSILCEVLTGAPAFIGRSAGEIQRKAARADLADATTRLGSCRADPELIALATSCLAPERDDRPRDAGAVAARVTAYRAGVQERLRQAELAQAAADARAAEERRKRRWQLGLAASVAGFLLLGGAGLAAFAAVVQSQNRALAKANTDLDTQRRRAEAREEQAIAAVKRFRDAVAENPELKNNPALESLRKTLMQEPLAFFRSLRAQLQADRDTRPAALERLAEAAHEYAHLSDEFGHERDGLQAHEDSLAIWERLTRDEPNNPEYRRGLAVIQNCRGTMLQTTGRLAEAEAAYKAALALRQPLAAEFPTRPELRQELARSHNNLGNLLANTGRLAEAEAAYKAALALRQPLAAEFPARPEFRWELALSHNNLGNLLSDTGRLAEAEAAYTAALALQKQLAAEFPTRPEFRRDLARSHNNLGVLLQDTGRLAEAEAAYTAALALQKQLAAEFPTRPELRRELANSHNSLGTLLANTGRLAEAEAAYKAALALRQPLAAEFPESPDYASNLGGTLYNLALIDLNAKRFEEARETLRQAIAWQKKALAANPRNPQYRQILASHYSSLLATARGLNDAALAAEAQHGLAALRDSDPDIQQLDARLAAVVGGAAPRDNTERLKLAYRAYEKGLHAASARLFDEALASDPALGEDRQAQHRYNAACAAALAAAGKGVDDPAPDEAAKARLRAQALAWLQAERAAWSRALESADERQRHEIAETLKHWQADADLAGAREPEALETLPEAERAEWQALWADVDRLRKQSEASP